MIIKFQTRLFVFKINASWKLPIFSCRYAKFILLLFCNIERVEVVLKKESLFHCYVAAVTMCICPCAWLNEQSI